MQRSKTRKQTKTLARTVKALGREATTIVRAEGCLSGLVRALPEQLARLAVQNAVQLGGSVFLKMAATICCLQTFGSP